MQSLDTQQAQPKLAFTRRENAKVEDGEHITKLFAALVALFGLLLLTVYGLDILRNGGTDFDRLIVGRDFVNMYFGGSLIADGHFATLADQEAYLTSLREWAGPDYLVHYWSYPPLMFPPAEGFAALPYPIALALWTGLGGAAIVGALRYAGLRSGWAALICLSPAGLVNLLAGQNGFFTAALTVTGLVATLHQQSVLAGASWTLLTIKPHLGVLILPLLICRRETRVFLIGALLFLVFLGITIFVYGPDSWLAFFDRTLPQQRWVAETWSGGLEALMPTFFMQVRSMGLGLTSAYALHICGATLTVLLLIRAWPERSAAPREWLAWLVCGTYLILPYSFIYDLVIFQILLALWHDAPERMFRTDRAMLARYLWIALWILPLLSILIMAIIGVQVLPFVLLALLWRLGCPQLNCSSAVRVTPC